MLNTVTVGMPRRSISTASATLIEVEVPQSPKHCTTAAQCGDRAQILLRQAILGGGLADDGPGHDAEAVDQHVAQTRDRKRSALTLLLSTKAMRWPAIPDSGRAAGTVGCSVVTTGSRTGFTGGSSMLVSGVPSQASK